MTGKSMAEDGQDGIFPVKPSSHSLFDTANEASLRWWGSNIRRTRRFLLTTSQRWYYT